MGQPTELKIAWQELNADAVRYSDWTVTLPPLIIDLHLMVDAHTALFNVSWSVILCVAMVLLGAFTRLGTDELVPQPRGQEGGPDCAMLLGIISFCLSFGCLALVLYNLLGDIENDPSSGWVYAFSIPWTAYGVVSFIAIVWRQVSSDGYPEFLSILKDLIFGGLDIWSKCGLAFFVSTKAFGINTVVFGL